MRKLYLFVTLIAVALYVLTLRGNLGVPTPEEIDYKLNSSGQAFETSQERSRYALILSLYFDKTFSIDNYASLGTPDVGFINGHYFSFFPPGVSVIAMPLFLLGLKIGAVQITTFLVSTIFALLTLLLIVKFSTKLGLSKTVAVFSAMSFAFATNAWGYSVTLYAHLVSGFILLLSLYIVLFLSKRPVLQAILVWVLYSLAVFVDFPNLFIFMPVALIFAFSGFTTIKKGSTYKISYKWTRLLSPVVFVLLMSVYGYYNYVNFGNPTTLSNTLPRVKDLKEIEQSVPDTGKDAFGALDTRNMLEGFRSFVISTDRGVIFYSPVVLLSLFAIFSSALKRIDKQVKIGLIGLPLVCLTLYTMFGDPYGGWAFGSRYLIAVLPELCILAGIALHHFVGNWVVKVVFSLVFMYSASVSLLAPLTTNVIPPKLEAGDLGLKYDYTINIDMLNKNELNTFVYNYFLKDSLSGWGYYFIIWPVVILVGLTSVWYGRRTNESRSKKT